MIALRFFGAVCIIAACSAWGLRRAHALRRRSAVLYAVCRALEQLKSEISELRAPLPEIIARLKTDAPELCRAWFSALNDALEAKPELCFSELWQRALETDAPHGLDAETKARISLLSLSLGRYDAPEQCAAIDCTLRAVEREQMLAEETARTQGRLYTGLGVAAGLLLAVILI